MSRCWQLGIQLCLFFWLITFVIFFKLFIVNLFHLRLSLALGNDSFGYLGSCHFQSCICCLYMPDMSCLPVKGRVKEVWRANLLTCFYFPGAMKWFLPTEPHVSDTSVHQEKTVSTLFFILFFFNWCTSYSKPCMCGMPAQQIQKC